ncbi:expressed unknown protein [Seminavis robusta]|uniref:Uncharacterized protein n=1 Tax=Seminavis robusta TaxID=568900 RepID=A0A9N8EUH4_9STRA|nr:expressed unknown protein [Seminavis robusta]|eukprot:Sro2001_g310330.1 n/a (474) ;mRNA; r:13305-14726
MASPLPSSPVRLVHNGGDVEEACTAPLLLNSPERPNEVHHHHHPHNQQEADHWQQAREIRRIRQKSCLVATLIFCSFLPTLVVITTVSPLFLAIGIFVFVRVSQRRVSSTIVPLVAFVPFLLINLAAMYVYNFMFGFDYLLVFSLILALLGAVGFYYWHRQHQELQDITTNEDPVRKKQLFFAYLETVQSVANSVRNNGTKTSSFPPEEATTELTVFRPPTQGFYRGSTVMPIKKTKKKQSSSRNQNQNNDSDDTTATTEQDNNPTADPSTSTATATTESNTTTAATNKETTTTKHDDGQLFLLFPRSDTATGWWIRGARKHANGSIQTIVLEGFVSLITNEAYWTEGTLDGKENTLYYGKFVHDPQPQFEGEWLSFTENQSHAYTMPLVEAADPVLHFGIVCHECQHSPHPGKCYTAKTTGAEHYCENCVVNNPSLIHSHNSDHEEEFIEWSLPEVNPRSNEKLSYSPPLGA